MRVGFVYDKRDDYLRLGFSQEETAEFDSEKTIAAIEQAINNAGYGVERIGNIWKLVEALAQGKRWDIVFNIAEGMVGLAREAQVPALLDAYSIPYIFSTPDVMVITLDKSLAKRVVRDAGIPTAPWAVIQEEEQCCGLTLPYPLFAKPLAEGTGKGVSACSRVENPGQLRAVCKDLLYRFRQPVLVETFLPGREFTVGIVGTGEKAAPIGALEIILNAGAEAWSHSYKNKEQCETLITYQLAKDETAIKAEDIAIRSWRALGCRDAGRIDVRCDAEGNPVFIEANPLAGLSPGHSDLVILAEQAGISYDRLIHSILSSARDRVSTEPSRARQV